MTINYDYVILLIFILVTVFAVYRSSRRIGLSTWKSVGEYTLKKLPALLFAIVASYGVYEFFQEIAPAWVALIASVSFESLYISLVLMADNVQHNRRYTAVVLSGVALSAIDNTLIALRELTGSERVLDALTLTTPLSVVMAAWVLAVLHGAPLSILSYNFLQVLRVDHHVTEHVTNTVTADKKRDRPTRTRVARPPKTMTRTRTVTPRSMTPIPVVQPVALAHTSPVVSFNAVNELTERIVRTWNMSTLSQSGVARELGVARQTVNKHLGLAKQAGMTVREG